MGPRLAIATGALALTLLVTWPLARCFGRCLGEGPDARLSTYFLSWIVHALTTPGARLLDASFFAPYSRTLALSEYVPAYALIALPVILVTGNPVVGHNVVVVLQYALAALGTTALAVRLLGATPPALVAGLVFAYSPRLLQKAHNIQLLSVVWFPWLFLALERFLARPTWGAAILAASAGLGLALSSIVDFVFAAVLVPVLLAVAHARGWRQLERAHLGRLAGVALPMAALLGAYVAPYRALARDWRLSRTLAEVEAGVASLGDYLSVPPGHLLHGLTGIGHEVDILEEALFPGITVVVLTIVGCWVVVRGSDARQHTLRPYVAMVGVAATLALGPTLHTSWGPVPLPYRALYAAVPGFDAIRTPARFLGFVGLGVALLAAAGTALLVRRLDGARRWLCVTGLALLVLLESVVVPFPGTAWPVVLDDAYRWLSARDASVLVLELPMRDDWNTLVGAAFHLRRTVNGWASYFPPHYRELAAAMEQFPDERSLALIRGLRPDFLLVDAGWLGPERRSALIASDLDIRLERSVGRYDVYRLPPVTPPSLTHLEATARLAGPPEFNLRYVCVTLRNAGSRVVPLYPLHRLRLDVKGPLGGPGLTRDGWLPLDLAPGQTHVMCAELRQSNGPVRVRGQVEGAGWVYRFEVTPGAPPQALRTGASG